MSNSIVDEDTPAWALDLFRLVDEIREDNSSVDGWDIAKALSSAVELVSGDENAVSRFHWFGLIDDLVGRVGSDRTLEFLVERVKDGEMNDIAHAMANRDGYLH